MWWVKSITLSTNKSQLTLLTHIILISHNGLRGRPDKLGCSFVAVSDIKEYSTAFLVRRV
jgi:hypothetical protein